MINKFQISDIVRITVAGHNFKGEIIEIVSINGEYHYGITNCGVKCELCHTEIKLVYRNPIRILKPINIQKSWSEIHEQSVVDSKGNTWRVADLVFAAKDLDIMEIPLQHLAIDKKIGSMQIREFTSHMKIVNDADLSFPIILDEDGAIFDGRHRVVKAILEGNKTIKAVRFESDPPSSSCSSN